MVNTNQIMAEFGLTEADIASAARTSMPGEQPRRAQRLPGRRKGLTVLQNHHGVTRHDLKKTEASAVSSAGRCSMACCHVALCSLLLGLENVQP